MSKKCPKCGQECLDEALFCFNCGNQFVTVGQEKKTKKSIFPTLALSTSISANASWLLTSLTKSILATSSINLAVLLIFIFDFVVAIVGIITSALSFKSDKGKAIPSLIISIIGTILIYCACLTLIREML